MLNRRHKKPWPLQKIFASLIVFVAVFAAGVSVGRGNVRLGFLSADQATSAQTSQLNYASVDQVYSLLKKDFDGNLVYWNNL